MLWFKLVLLLLFVGPLAVIAWRLAFEKFPEFDKKNEENKKT